MKDYAKALRFTISLLLMCLLGVGGGYFLDERLKTTPLFLISFLLLGTVLAFYKYIKEMKKDE